jgi:hypothetical protein
MIEEMCAAYWRQRRAGAMETALLDKEIALQPDGSDAERMASAFDTLAAAPTLALLHRYETRHHLMYQRALRAFTMLRTAKYPNDSSPISEHPPEAATPAAPTVAPSATGLPACRPRTPRPYSTRWDGPSPSVVGRLTGAQRTATPAPFAGLSSPRRHAHRVNRGVYHTGNPHKTRSRPPPLRRRK